MKKASSFTHLLILSVVSLHLVVVVLPTAARADDFDFGGGIDIGGGSGSNNVFDTIASDASKVADSIGQGTDEAVRAVESGAGDVAQAVERGAESVLVAVENSPIVGAAGEVLDSVAVAASYQGRYTYTNPYFMSPLERQALMLSDPLYYALWFNDSNQPRYSKTTTLTDIHQGSTKAHMIKTTRAELRRVSRMGKKARITKGSLIGYGTLTAVGLGTGYLVSKATSSSSNDINGDARETQLRLKAYRSAASSHSDDYRDDPPPTLVNGAGKLR